MPWADLGVVEDFPSKPQCLATPLPVLFPRPPSGPTAYLIKTITGWLIPKEVPGPEKSSKNSLKNGLLAKSILSQTVENKHCFFPSVGKPYIVFWGLLERAEIFFFSGKMKTWPLMLQLGLFPTPNSGHLLFWLYKPESGTHPGPSEYIHKEISIMHS